MDTKTQLLSLGYTSSRALLSSIVSGYQTLTNQPKDYETVISIGHKLLKNLGPLEGLLTKYDIPENLSTPFHHIQFPSPLILAAFEGDWEIIRIWSQFGLGGVTLKTILNDPRPGNPRPRIQSLQTPSGEALLNAMGLPGKGLKKYIQDLKRLKRIPSHKPIGFSVGGHSLDAYIQTTQTLLQTLTQTPLWKKRPYFIEVNISCPNTPDGQSFLKHPEFLDQYLKKIKADFPDTIIGPKLSPDQSNEDLLTFAQITANYPLTFLTLGNTQYRSCISLGLDKNALSIGGGGLSGSPLFPRTLEMVTLLAPHNIPIIAVGGIKNAHQVKELQENGATLVGMATTVVQDPFQIPLMNHALSVL